MGKHWLVPIALAACAHAGPGSGSAGFRVFYPEQTARAGQHVELKPAADCNYDSGREARWTTTGAHVSTGALPPGVAIVDGALSGVPKQAGTFTATIVFEGVTCAGKPQPDQQVDVHVVVR